MFANRFFVEVIVPKPVKGTFCYCVPQEMISEVEIGKRVVVPFGRNGIYTGIIAEIHDRIPKEYEPKSIINVLDTSPVIREQQLRFWHWLSSYYLAHEGEILKAALPSALNISRETKIILHPQFNGNFSLLNEKEFLIAEALTVQPSLTLMQISDIVDQKNTVSLIRNLLEKKIAFVEDELEEIYKPKLKKTISLNPDFKNEQKLEMLFNQLEKKAFKQLEVLMTYIKLSNYYGDNPTEEIELSILLKIANATHAQIKSLVNKSVFIVTQKEVSRLTEYQATKEVTNIVLSHEQQTAFNAINLHFNHQDTVLLHGVTGSGKTEIYIKLIAETLAKGKQVLYLLPEIALTTQIVERLRQYFGNCVGVYHSRFSPFERVEIWNQVLNYNGEIQGKHQIILGARSSIFLPFSQLGLVIIDEEHDNSYKQQEPSPRYNGRDVALYLAKMHGANSILGSATPAVESYYNALHGKYKLVNLLTRYGDIKLPHIMVCDLKIAKKRKEMHAMFSSELIKEIKSTLDEKKQVLLFQNRRGFSLRIECEICNWVPQCKHCDVALIYHKKSNLIKCHYCGYTEVVPDKCPKCSSTHIFMHGFGTEKVESELKLLFPERKIKRMDLDTTRAKGSIDHIFHEFEKGNTDILVGTHMITKGLDFENIGLSAIINADSILTYPDFRAQEKGFQLMAQVSGRSGRKNQQGRVIIQTHNPINTVINQVVNHDYKGMYQLQIAHRNLFHYPPFYRIIRVELRHKDFDTLNRAAFTLTNDLQQHFHSWVLGPEFPVVARIRNHHIKHIFIKIPSNTKLSMMKQTLIEAINNFKLYMDFKSTRIIIDVDPL